MEGKSEKSLDLISDLPVPILHQILSFLPIRNSVRTSVLSKQWNSIQKSFPILDFTLYKPVESAHFNERCGEYLDFVNRSLQNFAQNKLRIEGMDLYLRGISCESIPLINTWLPIALHNGVSDLHFNVEVDKAYYPLPETTFVVNSSLLRGSSGFFRLKKLNLFDVCLSENIICDIIRNCPNISDLHLLYIRGLKTLNISKPNKLESLFVSVPEDTRELESIFVDALSLEFFSLEFGDLEPRTPCAVDLTCYNLRQLNLSGIDITDVVYHSLIARYPLLVDLMIQYCHLQPRIRISLQRLEHLELSFCSGLEVIEFDAPILSDFEFMPGEEILPYLVSRHVIPGSMHLSYDTKIMDNEVDCFWFRWIREYLSAPFKGISFYPYYEKMEEFDDVSFDIDELISDAHGGIPALVELDCLDLNYSEAGSYWETYLDGLLWSCHPKTVRKRLKEDSNDENNCIKIFCRMLTQSECKLCCNSAHCNCWRRCLIAAKLESIKGIPLDIEGFDPNLFLHTSKESEPEVLFTLNWDHSGNIE